ncbi:unnamed protein product [Caretta caretta]
MAFTKLNGPSGEQLEQVLELERHVAASPEDLPLCGARREKREEFRVLEDHRAWGAFVRSHIRLLREMDRSSHFFYALEKRRGAKKHATCLLAEDGTPLTELVEMCGRARAFYASLFSPDLTDPGACRVLWEELPMVSARDQDRLELPLTLAEFSEALCRMPANKSPGMDGLTVEFYCVFWDVLGPDLVTVWAESLQSGVLPLSCRRAVLALLPKKGDLRDLRNWRPVSLLSTDYKIVVKAISLRLGSVLADVIHPDQTYTVLDRSIFDNLFLVWDLLELGRRDGLSFALLSLDQEKAFDRVDHRRLTGFVLQEPKLQLVLLAYADDVLLVVQDPGDLAQVEACQSIYLAASSAWVNWVKSAGLVVGDWRQASSLPPTLQTVRWSTGVHLPRHLGSSWSAWWDFNTTLEERDCFGTEQCLATEDVLWEIVEHHSLVDIWHDHHPDDISTFTFVQVEAHQSHHSWLDRIYLSRFHLSRDHSSSIWPAPFSDHHLAT